MKIFHRKYFLFGLPSLIFLIFFYSYYTTPIRTKRRQQHEVLSRTDDSLARWRQQVREFESLNYVTSSDEITSYMTSWNLLSDVENKWRNVRSNLRKSSVSDQDEPLKLINQQYINIRRKIENTMKISEKQRENEMRELSETVTQKIHDLMNPTDCDSSQFLFCGLLNDCGFGCDLHFVVHCLLYALEMNRTIVFDKKMTFSKQGWEFGFLPLAKCKIDIDLKTIPALTNEVNLSQVESEKFLVRPNNRFTMKYSEWHDWTIPSSLAPSLIGIHGDPFAWWIGQLTSYAMRLKPWFDMDLLEWEINTGFDSPIAGIHIRRGDKIGAEADYHPVEEYMFYVDLWFDQIQETKKRTVYLATDDSTVLSELEEKYPDYTFIGRKLSRKKNWHENEDGFKDIIFDIHLLSKCDFLVCTGTSNVCRASYELMSSRMTDASTRFISLDFPYFYRAETFPYDIVKDHNATYPDEMDLEVGDVIIAYFSAFGVNLDGFVNGHNTRTEKDGRFPLYKARKKINYHKYKLFKT